MHSLLLLFFACTSKAGGLDSHAKVDDSTPADDSTPVDDSSPIDDSAAPLTRLDPSQDPPGGLSPSQVPMFVSIGFDDNGYSGVDGSGGTGGMTWALDALAARTNSDGSPAKVSFYMSSTYIGVWMAESPTYVKQAWHRALTDGHELGNHTHAHSPGGAFDEAAWDAEVSLCTEWLTKPFDPNEELWSPDETKGIGLDGSELFGFRTPFLEYNDALFSALESDGFLYDCSIEEGWQWEQDGTDYNWPYTLDGGSPGNDVLVEWGLKEAISPRPGLWEMPVHPVIVPPDELCEQYGVPPGLRAKMKSYQDWYDEDGGKITGFDYNLWVLFQMTKEEFLATLKYTLDLRLQGNRAPMMFGAHTDYYSDRYTGVPNATVEERQEAIEEFLDYAVSKPEVRVVPTKEILDWIRNPTAMP